jgi:hypothetical protein
MRVHQKRLLDKGKIEKLVAALRSLVSTHPEVVEKIRTEADYFQRNTARMRYLVMNDSAQSAFRYKLVEKMTPSLKLTISGLRVRAVDVPLARPLQTGGGPVLSAPLALIDLETKQGVTGSSYLFCVTPTALKPTVQLLQNLSEWLDDKPLQPYQIERTLHERLRLVGVLGLTGMAIAGIDMAAWDAHSKACGLPLVRCSVAGPNGFPPTIAAD